MAAKYCKLLRCKKGDAAVEFVMTAAVLILIFAVLVTALVYVMQYYNASFLCRKVTRSIEVSGQYDVSKVDSLADALGGDALEDLQIDVDASYFSGRKIQLRDDFTVSLSANYKVAILRFGGAPIYMTLPIQIRQVGMSEVFWR